MKRKLVVFITTVFICAAFIDTCFGESCCPGNCCPPAPAAAPTVPAENISSESLEAPEIKPLLQKKQEIKVYEKQNIDVNESDSKEKQSPPDKKAE